MCRLRMVIMMNLQEYFKKHGLSAGKFAAVRKGRDSQNGIQMTAMQDEVLSGEAFWNTAKNLIIQGATSSGKTLLAEIAAYRQIVDDEIWHKKVIFLVPLRALVTAQCKQIQEDFQNVKLNENSLRIFESSADYQDHDAQILNGEYEIAVIVYEKFFALLNSENNQRRDNYMLKNCGLVIVDELQMLSSKDRGPKMEFSIMRLLETCQQNEEEEAIRIIGLTTSESDVDALGNWMNAEVVGNDKRPVPLRQYIVSYNTGKVRCRDVPGETSLPSPVDSDENPDEPDGIELFSRFRSGSRDEDKKRTCLYSLLAKLLEQGNSKQGNGEKILIFTNTKRKAHEIANEIVRKFPLFEPPAAIDNGEREEFAKRLNNVLTEFNDEDGINDLKRLVLRGVAFHHSGLPAVVRSIIEDDFHNENGHIQMIVCTETLMIGMNLPADVVILYDGTVYRGAGTPERISLQAYNNFVGRAGRLGMRRTQNYYGESYLLTENLAYDYRMYTADERTPIQSPFRPDQPDELAPYFLNWIGSANTAEERIEKGVQESFCYYAKKEKPCVLEQASKTILDHLISAIPNPGKRLLRRYRGYFWLSNYGQALAPYALSLDTCKILIKYIEQSPVMEEDFRFIAPDDEEKRNPPKALLELILTICSCSEVDKNPALNVFINDRNRNEIRTLNQALQSCLREIYPNNEGDASQKGQQELEDVYEDESAHQKLVRIAYSSYLAESDELRQIVRAFILCYWLAGYHVRKIKKILQLNSVMVSTSDIERISETAAYLIEATGKCQECLINPESDSGLYWLSIRMKYGIPHELHSLANTHVREITRNQLLTIWRKAKQAHKTPRDYIMASADSRYQALRKALQERERVNNYQQQIENIQEEDPSFICKRLSSYLQKLDMHSNFGEQECRAALSKILTTLSQEQGTGWSISAVSEGLEFAFSSNDHHTYYLQFELFDMSDENSDKWYEKISEFKKEPARDRNQHLVKIAVLYGAPPAGEENLPSDLLVLSSELLGVLIAKCIRDSAGTDTVKLIYCMLADLKGRFILNGTSFFHTYGPISDLIKGYLHNEPDTGKPGLLYYSGITDPAPDSPCAVVPWGNSDEMAAFKAMIAFYHPALLFSKSAEAYLKNCGTILCPEEDYKTVNQKYSNENIIIINSNIDEMLEVVVKTLQQPAGSDYEFDFGISLRGNYIDKMGELKNALVREGKQVLLMNSDDFSQRMGGCSLIEALHREFSHCRHIIICDTFDYDESPYTAMVEFNVVMDKITLALQKGRRYPVYRVRLPGVEGSPKLSYLFKDHYSTYDGDNVKELAEEIIGKSKCIEREFV